MTHATNRLHPSETVPTDQRSSSTAMLHDEEPLLDVLLKEQQQLTAVERFARTRHSNGEPAQATRYTELLLASPPRAGQQYAFEVDLDRCSGCKACVSACHSLNGLDDDETWRDVGLLHGGTSELPVLQHVTSACHHCLEPACLTACPVDAYEKDPATGIVKHLDDQCIGCRYCTLACPYDVPKYNKSKGIVRKCDLCSDRLAVGEAPACVQACPHEAISINVVDVETVVADSETNRFLPGAPDPHVTLPTTNYRTNRVLPRNMLPADYYAVHREQAHWPLIVMLVLTQLSVGAFLVELVLTNLLEGSLIDSIRPVHTASALFFGLLALGASLFHLGRPLYAFRAIIGLKHSWLSREILAFGIFAALAALYAGLNWFTENRDQLPFSFLNEPEAVSKPVFWWVAGVEALRAPSICSVWGLTSFDPSHPLRVLKLLLGWTVVGAGLAGLVCSMMVYAFTRRVFWNGFYTGTRFLSTAVLLGIATTWMTVMLVSVTSGSAAARQIVSEYGPTLCTGLMATAAFKLLFEAALFRHLASKRNSPLKRSALLMSGDLSNATLARFSCGFLGGVFMPGFLLLGNNAAHGDLFLSIVVVMLFIACLSGEILERYLFFTAVAAPKMPGDFIA